MLLSNLVKNRLYGHNGVDVLKNDIKEHSVEIETINSLLWEENQHLSGENI